MNTADIPIIKKDTKPSVLRPDQLTSQKPQEPRTAVLPTKNVSELNFEEKYRLIVKYNAIGPEDRPTESFNEFCRMYNISQQDVEEAVARPEYPDDIDKATVRWVQLKMPTLVHGLVDGYRKGRKTKDFDSIVAFLNAKNKTNQNQQFNFFNVNDEQFKRIITREARILSESGTE